jgi:hypothetical protein
MTNLFYSRQDVEDASWILSTMHTLNHGIAAELWAAKVIAWYHNFISFVKERVAKIRDRGITTPIKELFEQTVTLIKNGVLIVNHVMLME